MTSKFNADLALYFKYKQLSTNIDVFCMVYAFLSHILWLRIFILNYYPL